MYEEYFGLTEKPFNKTPDPRFLYQSRKHAEALARIQHAVEEQGIPLLHLGFGDRLGFHSRPHQFVKITQLETTGAIGVVL